MSEWFKQLFAESEGKDNKGIFPASVIFSTDLHSLGQYIQDGRRTMFETVVLFDKCKKEVTLESLLIYESHCLARNERIRAWLSHLLL